MINLIKNDLKKMIKLLKAKKKLILLVYILTIVNVCYFVNHSYCADNFDDNSQNEKDLLLDSIIKKNPLSLRCSNLFQEISKQKKLNQKLSSLIARCDTVLSKNSSSEIQKNLKIKIKSTRIKVKNELYLSELKLKNLDEKVIRSGCPKPPFSDF